MPRESIGNHFGESSSEISDSDTEMATAESFGSTSSGQTSTSFAKSKVDDIGSMGHFPNHTCSPFYIPSKPRSYTPHGPLDNVAMESTSKNFQSSYGSDQMEVDSNVSSSISRTNRLSACPTYSKSETRDLVGSLVRASPVRPRELPCRTSSPILDNDSSELLRADTRIPFSNYLNNLNKILQIAAAKGELGKSRNLNENQRKNMFNFYWETDIQDADHHNGDSVGYKYQPHQTNSDDQITGQSRLPRVPLKTDQTENTVDYRNRRSLTRTPPMLDNTATSSEGSPILSGHLQPLPNFQSPPDSQPFLAFSNYSRGLMVPTQGFVAPGQYPVMTPAPYHPLTSFRSQNHNEDKASPVKKYKCDVCGKAFSRSNTLVTHKRIHTGAKPFRCDICGRAFRQPGNLTRHKLTHTSVKPYVCPQCNKAFNRASNLNTHMRTHNNHRPFSCNCCGKGFSQKVDLKIHSYTHMGKRTNSYRH